MKKIIAVFLLFQNLLISFESAPAPFVMSTASLPKPLREMTDKDKKLAPNEYAVCSEGKVLVFKKEEEKEEKPKRTRTFSASAILVANTPEKGITKGFRGVRSTSNLSVKTIQEHAEAKTFQCIKVEPPQESKLFQREKGALPFPPELGGLKEQKSAPKKKKAQTVSKKPLDTRDSCGVVEYPKGWLSLKESLTKEELEEIETRKERERQQEFKKYLSSFRQGKK